MQLPRWAAPSSTFVCVFFFPLCFCFHAPRQLLSPALLPVRVWVMPAAPLLGFPSLPSAFRRWPHILAPLLPSPFAARTDASSALFLSVFLSPSFFPSSLDSLAPLLRAARRMLLSPVLCFLPRVLLLEEAAFGVFRSGVPSPFSSVYRRLSLQIDIA